MSNDKLGSIKDKLIKLIAKEESAREIGNTQEAEAFAAHIRQLLLQYELDVKDLRMESGESLIITEELFDTKPLTTRHESNWGLYMYNACSKASFCTVLCVGKSASTTWIKIIGTKVNIEMLHLMCSTMMNKVRPLARSEFNRYVGPDKRNTWIRGFLKGACSGIARRLEVEADLEQRGKPNVQGLIHDKNASMDKYMAENYPQLKTAKGRAGSSSDGYKRGIEVGSSIDVSKGGKLKGGPKLLNA